MNFGNKTYHEPDNCLFDLKYSENARKLSVSTSFSGGKSLVHAASSPSLSDMFYDCHSNHPEASSGTLRGSSSNSAVDDALSCVRSRSMKRCKSLPSGFANSCDNSLIMEQNSNNLELEIPIETKMDTCAEWCNSSIMRMVLEYLVDTGPTTTTGAAPALKGTPDAKSDSRKGSRRQNGASQDSESKHAMGALEGFPSALGTGGQDASFFS